MKKRIAILLAGFLGLVILAMVLLPGFAKRYAVKHSKEYTGRQFTIEKVKLNYFTSTVRITGFKLFEENERDVFVSFDTLLVNFQPLNLLRNELVIEKLHLTGLHATIIQKDSSFNFDDIVGHFTKQPGTEEIDTTPAKPLRFRMSDLELKHARFVFDDQNVGKVTHLSDFSLAVPFIAWNQEDKSQAGVRFAFADEGYFESSINVDPVNGDYIANVTINRLNLEAFQEYISHFTQIHSLNGIFNCQVSLSGNVNKVEDVILAGLVNITSLTMNDQQGEKFIGTDRIDLGIKKVDFAQSRYEFDSLILTAPYVHFILSNSTNNISEAFRGPVDSSSVMQAAEPDSLAPSSADPFYYSLDKFVIKEGMADYTDNLTGDPTGSTFEYHLDEITLNADSITSEARWVNLYSQMMLNNRGSLMADVGFDPVDPLKNISLDYVISDFLLSDLNIYSRHYMGFPIILGDMYYKSETKITGGQLNSENKLVMTDVKLGEKGRGLYDLPIKLALFILKDRYGVINLDVPVRGDLNDPKVRIGKIIWNTFKNLIIKVATAPYDALAGQVGADPKELESIVFDHLDTALTAQRQRQLDLLLRLENQKEGLAIQLTYYNDSEKEKEIIAGAEQDLKTPEEIQAKAELYSISRRRVLENYLQSVNDSTSIRINSSNAEDPKNVGSMPLFHITYSLGDKP